MSFLKSILKMFSCESSCKFNNQDFDYTLHTRPICDFKLKNKDIVKINKILSKRQILTKLNNITEI